MPLSKGANERLWDALIKEALIESMNRELEELGQNTAPHSFSPKFKKKMAEIITSIGRKEKIQVIGKAICKFSVTAAAFMGLVFGGFLTQPEVYAAVGNVIRSIFSTHDNYSFQTDDSKIQFDKNKQLGYVPDGYELRSAFYSHSNVLLTYESVNEKIIEFEYGLADGTSISIDNERHTFKEINHNEHTYYFEKPIDENDFSSLIWYDSGYVYSIDAQIRENELVKIAENIIS